MDRLKLLLLQGGPSSEHDVSLSSGRTVAKELDPERYEVTSVIIGKDGQWYIGTDEARAQGDALAFVAGKYDVAFVAMHGAFGEDGTIQGLLEGIALPYTGSGPAASALAMDKAESAERFRQAGLAVPPFSHTLTAHEVVHIGFPSIIKPCHGGSSVGLCVAHDIAQAAQAVASIINEGDTAIIQQMIAGREFTCGVLDDEQGKPFALPPTEIIPLKGGLFDYEAKYTAGASREVTPPELSQEQIAQLQAAALTAHTTLGCSGMSRSDFMLADGMFYILETNTIPGMTPMSLLPQEAAAVGISFSGLLDRMIASALRRR